MPVFHFDVRYDDEEWSDDPDGLELNGIDEARIEALDLARGLAKEHILGCREIAIRVRDGQPEPVIIVRLSMTAQERAGPS